MTTYTEKTVTDHITHEMGDLLFPDELATIIELGQRFGVAEVTDTSEIEVIPEGVGILAVYASCSD